MAKYIIKVGEYYVRGKKDYTHELGYLPSSHPKTTVIMDKFDFKAKQFNREIEAIKFAEKFSYAYQVIEIKDEDEQLEEGLGYCSGDCVAKVFQKFVHDNGMSGTIEFLQITPQTYEKLYEGRVDEIGNQSIIRILRLIVAKGYKEVSAYLNYRKELHRTYQFQWKMNALARGGGLLASTV